MVQLYFLNNHVKNLRHYLGKCKPMEIEIFASDLKEKMLPYIDAGAVEVCKILKVTIATGLPCDVLAISGRGCLFGAGQLLEQGH